VDGGSIPPGSTIQGPGTTILGPRYTRKHPPVPYSRARLEHDLARYTPPVYPRKNGINTTIWRTHKATNTPRGNLFARNNKPTL
jgi:hypothetical protein